MSAFDRKVRILSEDLARTLDRRKFLKQAGATMFAGIAALAAGHSWSGVSSANGITPSKQPLVPVCSPPGPYCNLNGNTQDPNGCHGGSCFQHLYQGNVLQCRVFYIYQAGCWTTPSGGGYWTCCDCECLNSSGTRVASCGCAQYSTQPIPRPDGPGSSPRA
jgi:hypothetical protein